MAGSVKLLTPSGGSVTINATDTASALSLTLPATNDNIITANTTQTLTNKTLTNPVINGFTGNTSAITIGTTQFVKDTSGNIGIGTSSPSFPNGTGLAVYNSTVPRIKLANSTTGDTATDGTQLLVSGSDFYIQQREAASVIIATNGSDRVTIDASGNLGLGRVTNANYRAVIRGIGTSSSTAGLVVENGVGTETFFLNDSGNLGLGVTPTTGLNGVLRYIELGPNIKGASFAGFASSTNLQTWVSNNTYYDSVSDRYAVTGAPASMFRCANGTFDWRSTGTTTGTAGASCSLSTFMTLDASGCLGVGPGAASPSSYGWITSIGSPITRPLGSFYSNTASDSAYPCIQIGKYANDSTTANLFVRFFYNNLTNGGGQINANGAGAAAFGAFSDARLKENILDLTPQLDNILALRPTEFDYIESEGGGHQIGFIAQEMQEVYPDVVGEGEDGMLTITGWSKTEARLVKAIQELSAQNNALEARLAKLEAK